MKLLLLVSTFAALAPHAVEGAVVDSCIGTTPYDSLSNSVVHYSNSNKDGSSATISCDKNFHLESSGVPVVGGYATRVCDASQNGQWPLLGALTCVANTCKANALLYECGDGDVGSCPSSCSAGYSKADSGSTEVDCLVHEGDFSGAGLCWSYKVLYEQARKKIDALGLNMCVPTLDAGAGVGFELCDGVDNDCDGTVDEGFTFVGTKCTVGVGVCEREGSYTCGGDTCSAIAGTPGPANCFSALDNDCNGEPDYVQAGCGGGVCSDDDDCAVSVSCTATTDGNTCSTCLQVNRNPSTGALVTTCIDTSEGACDAWGGGYQWCGDSTAGGGQSKLMFCSAGQCAPTKGICEDCSSDDECASGSCGGGSGKCVDGDAADLFPVSAVCCDDDQCQSGGCGDHDNNVNTPDRCLCADDSDCNADPVACDGPDGVSGNSDDCVGCLQFHSDGTSQCYSASEWPEPICTQNLADLFGTALVWCGDRSTYQCLNVDPTAAGATAAGNQCAQTTFSSTGR